MNLMKYLSYQKWEKDFKNSGTPDSFRVKNFYLNNFLSVSKFYIRILIYSVLFEKSSKILSIL